MIYFFFSLPKHSINPPGCMTGIFSKMQMHRPSRHSVWGTFSSHCSVKKHDSFTLAAVSHIKHCVKEFHYNIMSLLINWQDYMTEYIFYFFHGICRMIIYDTYDDHTCRYDLWHEIPLCNSIFSLLDHKMNRQIHIHGPHGIHRRISFLHDPTSL